VKGAKSRDGDINFTRARRENATAFARVHVKTQ